MRYSKRMLTMLITVTLLTAALVGCGSDDSNENAAPTETMPAPDAVLEESVEQIQAAESLELEMDVQGSPVTLDVVGLELPAEYPLLFKYARGIFQAPDRINANIQFSLGNFSTTADLIAVDRDHYFRGDLLTANRWINDELIPGFSPAELMSPEIGIPHALASVTGLTIQERTRMRGLDVFHLSGSIQASAVHSLTFGLIKNQDGDLAIEIYVSANDYRIAQIRLTEPPPNAGDEPTTWDISILNYNQSVEISTPAADNTPANAD